MEARAKGPSGGAGATRSAPAPPSSARAARVLLDLAGAGLFAAAFRSLAVVHLFHPIRGFDEGVLLTDAMLVLGGKVPYRDFYTNYPPGIFETIAGLWRVFGVRPEVLRFLGLGLQAGLALVAGRLAGRAGGRRFSWLGAGLVLAWTTPLGAVPFAWLAALLAALLFVERIGAAGPSQRGRWVAAGLALGAVGCYRHDLLVYFGLVLAAVGAAWAVRNRRLRPAGDVLRAAQPAAAAAAALLALVFVPALVRSGFGRLTADLCFDQVRWVMPSRVLPVPDLLASVPALGTRLPAVVARPFEGAVALGIAAPFLGLVALLLTRRSRGRVGLDLLLTAALSVAVLPQLFGRTDLWHALFTVTPALVLGTVLAERAATASGPCLRLVAPLAIGAALALPAVAGPGALPGRRPASTVPGPSARYGRLPESSAAQAAARREVFAFLDARGRPGEPIFVGATDHRWPMLSEMELYYLADRTGATREMQFDPGLVARREVQEEMVRDLERARPAAVVLSRTTLPREPKRGAAAGSTLLDDYLASRYRRAGSAGPYVLLERR